MSDEQKDEPEIVYENGPEENGLEQAEGDFDLDETNDSGQILDKIKKIKEKLKKCNEEKQEYLTGWQRAQADFINYRKRQEEQMEGWMKMAEAGLITDLLAVLDTLDSAIKNHGGDGGSAAAIKKQFEEILKNHGLEEIKAAGEKFNPEFHEAIERVEAGAEEGIVIEEIQKGYLLNGKVLRVAKVKVSK